jgi:dethiobiotin synthetase
VSRILFVTGTDTDVGKTLLTVSLLFHLRQSGVNALAMKPFCSGGTGDVDLIQAVQGRGVPREMVNPFYFSEAVAPLAAARKLRQSIRLSQVLAAIRRMRERCACLIVEGSGGLLVPLGEGFTVADLIANLDCDVVVVGRNKLGTINHTLLTVEALRARAVRRIKVVMMGQSSADSSVKNNAALLGETLANIELFSIPYLGARATQMGRLKRNVRKIKKTLAQIGGPDNFSTRSSTAAKPSSKTKGLKETKKDR